jgi:hypothetical protein
MLEILELRREGFNEKVSIGESIEYSGEKYIIIRIIEIRKLYFSRSINLKVRVLAQNVKHISNYRNYKREAILTSRYDQSKEDKRIIKKGDIIFPKPGIAYEVVSINQFYYEWLDIIVEYYARMIVPWSKEEMDEALKNERKSKFKVLEGIKG